MKIAPMARERKHTLHFLAETRTLVPVFLDTEVDMTRVMAHRLEMENQYSIVTYVLHAAGRVLAAHPEANAAVVGGIRPRVARYNSVDGKIALDKTMGGHRVVLSAVLPGLHRASLAEIQQQVDHYRAGDADRMPEFAGLRALHRLPLPIGLLLFRRVVRPLRNRPGRFGTFAISALGHRAVDGFHSVGGTTITIGVGRVLNRPVARRGRVEIAPVARLNLAFDHRVIDGAEAADVLTDLKDALENFRTASAEPDDARDGQDDELGVP